jgi:hypothetical protein
MMKLFTSKPLILAAGFAMASSLAVAADFGKFDANADGILDTNEYYGYVSDAGMYSGWNADNNGLIEENEFGKMGVDNKFSDWDEDTNGCLDTTEVYDGLYSSYDENENGHWDNGEWDDAGDSGLFDL